MGGKLMLSERHAAKESKTITNPGSSAGQNKSLPPDITDTDYKYKAKGQTGIAEAGKRIQCTAAWNFFMQHAGKQRKINTCDKADGVGQISNMEISQHSLNCKIKNHYPQGTACIKLFHILAVFICTNSAYNGEKENAGNRGQEHTQKCDAQQHNGRLYSCFQSIVLSFSLFPKIITYISLKLNINVC